MLSEKVFLLLARTLHEKAKELSADVDSRRDFSARLAEIGLCRKIISDAEKQLDTIENKLALEWQRTTKKRLVWQLWSRRKLS